MGKRYSSSGNMNNGAGMQEWKAGLTSSFSSKIPRCYESHPVLSILGGKIVGGACSAPLVNDSHIHIGFDHSMALTARRFPWSPGTEFLYPITDMQAPDHPESFAKLVDYILAELAAGKKIHLGCIGGHGRTGTVLAAVVAKGMGIKDAITWVRENYCVKAVESKAQVDFLVKNFGVKPIQGHKEGSQQKDKAPTNANPKQKAGGAQGELLEHKPEPGYAGPSRTVRHKPGAIRCIW